MHGGRRAISDPTPVQFFQMHPMMSGILLMIRCLFFFKRTIVVKEEQIASVSLLFHPVRGLVAVY